MVDFALDQGSVQSASSYLVPPRPNGNYNSTLDVIY